MDDAHNEGSARLIVCRDTHQIRLAELFLMGQRNDRGRPGLGYVSTLTEPGNSCLIVTPKYRETRNTALCLLANLKDASRARLRSTYLLNHSGNTTLEPRRPFEQIRCPRLRLRNGLGDTGLSGLHPGNHAGEASHARDDPVRKELDSGCAGLIPSY